jgi:TolB-like protein/Flp pilus assembly protein TadD
MHPRRLILSGFPMNRHVSPVEWTLVHVSRAELDALLERIEGSPGFSRGGNLIRFLRYAAIETLEGRGERVKEYTVAVEVFGRPSSYDPQVDSLVRVQASLLRSRLEQYYSSDGRDEPVILQIPKGGYQVNFIRASPASVVNGHSPAALVAEPTERHARFGKVAGIAAVLIVIAAVSIWLPSHPHQTANVSVPAPSIAVLPFVDMSPGGDHSFLGDGIADELIHSVGEIPGLRVVARTSAFQYRSKEQDIRRIGRELNVSYIVEGSVRREKSTLRVTAEMINAATGYQTWSAAYERTLDDLLPVEQEIAQAIAASLRTRNFETAARSGAPAPEAYRHYMTGNYWRVEPTVDHLYRARDEYAAAIAADPAYAPAHAGLAECLARLCFTEVVGGVPDLIARARESAHKAVELDDLLGAAHEASALVHMVDWQFADAEHEYRRALQLAPSNVRVRYAFAQLLLNPGLHYDEAANQLRAALELDPVSQNLITELGATYRLAHKPEAAMVQFRHSLDLNPRAYGTRTNMAVLEMETGRYDQAITLLKTVNVDNPGDPWILGHLGYAYGKIGRTAEARAILATLLKTSTAAMHIAAVYVGLRENGHALDALERGAAMRSPSILWLRTDFRFAPLRDQARYAAIAAKLPR